MMSVDQFLESYGRNARAEPFSWHFRSAVTKRHQSDYIDWDKGRDGYVNSPTAYAPVPKPAAKASGGSYLLSISAQVRFGSLIASGGRIRAAVPGNGGFFGLWWQQDKPPRSREALSFGCPGWLPGKWA